MVELKMDAERPRAVLELKNKLLPPTPPSSSPISAPTSNPFDSVTRRPVRMKVPMRPCGQQQYHPLTTFRVYMLCPSCTVVRKETESKIAVLKQELKSAKIRVEGLLFLEKARGKKEQLRSFPEYCDDIKLKESCWEEEAAAIEKEMRENEGVIEIVEWLAEDGEETW